MRFNEISLSFIIDGSTYNYVVAKQAIYLLWNCSIGIFDDKKISHDSIADFFSGNRISLFYGFNLVPKTLLGSIIINFDKKCIVDDNRFGNSLRMIASWIKEVIESDSDFLPGIISACSIKDHINNGRLRLEPAISSAGSHQDIETFDGAIAVLRQLEDHGRIERHWFCLSLPQSWTYISGGSK